MNLETFLCSLCQRLQDTAAKDDREKADELFTVFSMLREISYEGENRELTGLLVDFVDAARDVAMEVKGKHPIPSLEAIKSAFSLKQLTK
jgi:hypothetical protein